MSNKDTLECPVWHLPEAAELSFANQLLNLHLERSLADLRFICQEKKLEENPGMFLSVSLLVSYNISGNKFSIIEVIVVFCINRSDQRAIACSSTSSGCFTTWRTVKLA